MADVSDSFLQYTAQCPICGGQNAKENENCISECNGNDCIAEGRYTVSEGVWGSTCKFAKYRKRNECGMLFIINNNVCY